MGIFSRLGTLIKSNLNDLISKAEDPQKMLNQIVLEMQNQLVEAKKQVATSIADEKRLKKQWDEQIELSKEWERKAMLAVRSGDDALAKEALTRKSEHDHQQAEFGKQWQLQKDAVDKLKDQLRTLNDKIEEAKRKKNLLVARQRRAQAQKRIAETMSSMSEKSAFDAFARMEERIETNERQLKASIEIEEEFTGDRLQQDFKALEKGAAAGTVDSQLLALKQKMGMLPANTSDRRAIGAGARDEEEVHAEIEDLGSEKKSR